MFAQCLIASVVMLNALPTTWIDGSSTPGSVAYPCQVEVVQKVRDLDPEITKARIAAMKKKGLG